MKILFFTFFLLLALNSIAQPWVQLPDFPGMERDDGISFVINNNAYCVSGLEVGWHCTGNGFAFGRVFDNTTLNEVWEYDFTTTNWTQKNNLPVSGLWRGSGFAIDTVGYICYGMNLNARFNHSVYRYDYVNDSWSVIPDITLPARNYIGTAVGNHKACLYGGQDSLNTVTNDLYVFDPADSSLTNLAGIPTAGRKGGMAFSLNNSFYVTTGLNVSQTRVKETWKYVDVVGIKETLKLKASLAVFPNPAANMLTIETDAHKFSAAALIQITNQLGEKLVTIPFIKQISISELPNGIYFLSVCENNAKNAVTKFVVAK